MRESPIPSWVASILLHVGVVLLLIYVSFGPELPPAITGVPVTLVSDAPAASIQPEPEIAPQETAPPPAPEATPAPPTPTPPTPAPPTPKPQPTPPAPAPTKPGKTKPLPQKPSPTPSTPFDPLAAARKDAGSAASAPHKPLPPGRSAGPIRISTNPSQGGTDLKGLVDKMGRYWKFDCSIEGNRNAVIVIQVEIDVYGNVVGEPKIISGGSGVFASAGPAAVRALQAGQKYSTDEVPLNARNQKITMTFRTQDQCGH